MRLTCLSFGDQDCVAQGLLESPEYTHAEMLQNASVLELAAHQIGVTWQDTPPHNNHDTIATAKDFKMPTEPATCAQAAA